MADQGGESTTTTQPARAATGLAGVGRCCLVLLRGPQLGRRIVIDESKVVLGRGSDAQLVIRDSSVSRHHCALEIRDGNAFVRDLSSTNGTHLGGQLLPPNEDFLLQSGDLIQAGDCVLKYLEEGAIESGYHEQLYRSMVLDELTGLHNRRFALEFLEREIARGRRHDRPLSIVLADIDHFKRFNDDFGHAGGDDVLRAVAACVKEPLRRESCAARYGGEEFLVILPETDLEGARAVAERIRQGVEALTPVLDGEACEVTLSAGVATWSDAMRNSEGLIRAADEMLYAAKDAGRNLVRA